MCPHHHSPVLIRDVRSLNRDSGQDREPELRMRLPLEGTIILPEVGNWEKNNKYQLQVQSKRTRSHIESGHQKPNKIN